MERHEDTAHEIKRVVLPSGKTIEVVFFRDDEAATGAPSCEPEPDQDLQVCQGCGAELVHPLEWEESGTEHWWVLLRCPNCHRFREGVFSQETVERFDEELDRGADSLARDYRRLVRANMAEEVERFLGALRADAILPEDFAVGA